MLYLPDPLTLNLDNDQASRFVDFVVTPEKTVEFSGPSDRCDEPLIEIGNTIRDKCHGWIAIPFQPVLEDLFNGLL